MWNVWDVQCSGYGMFQILNFRYVKCLGFEMFLIGIFGRKNVHYTGFLGCGML